MRILYSFPHTLGRAGIAETALQQILGLDRLGVEVVLFCGSIGGLVLPSTIEVHQSMTVLGRRIPHRVIGVQRAYDHHDRSVAHWLARNSDRIDVVHAWPRGCIRTLTEARQRRVVALRESPNPHTASVMRASAAASVDAGVPLPAHHSHSANARVLERENEEYAMASAVLVPSDYARGEFIAEGFPPERLLQHRYGCDLSRFPQRIGNEHPPHRPFRAAFVGRGDPTKGLHIALAAWERASLPDAEFVIAGSILPEYELVMRDRLSLPGVRALGFVTDVPSVLGTSDVLLLPSWTEGSALVILEAQASGCIPLVSVASGALGVAGTLFLEHEIGAVDVLAAQLADLAGDLTRLATMSAAATASRAQLSWDAATRDLLKCYQTALAASYRD